MGSPRVAYLLPDAGIPVGGTKGGSVHVAEVCTALAAGGASVTLLAQRVSPFASGLPRGVSVIPLDPGPLARGQAGDEARIDAAQDFARRALPILEGLRPDLVYERLSLFFAGGGELAQTVGAARLVEVNAPVAAERERHFGLSCREIAGQAERDALAGASVMAVSDPLAAWALEMGAATAQVVPNGVDSRRFDPRSNRAAALAVRRALGLEGAEVVGFVGSLKPWHGVEVLLSAVGRLAPDRPNLRVLVVGDGPGRATLERQALGDALAGRVTFAGAVPSSEVPAHLAAFDVAVAPFLPAQDFYFSPLKVVEAMAAGRPIIASRFRPIEEMLRGAGLLVPPGDPEALAGAIAGVLDDRSEAARLGAMARRQAVDEHSWDRVASLILAAAARLRHPEGAPR
ncbi:MAG: glycosyltransferase family 4 protein [Candidatus Dormibacteria bacterium]